MRVLRIRASRRRNFLHVYRSYVLTVMRAAGRVPHRLYPSQAYITRLQCRPGVWNQPTTSGRFPDCSYPSQVLQVPRTRAVPASGQSLVASLTVPFPPRPTSPAYSPTSPACALRCRKPLFFAVCTCRRFESHVLFHTDSPTCVFPCPRALYDAMASPEASWRTAEPRHGRGLPLERAGTAHAAFRPLDPTLIAQCFFLIGRRPVACSAIVLRLALREGRPISRARLLFYPAIRVDSPTSPAVACSVRRQLSLHVERRAPRYESERTALVVAAPALVFETATSAPLRVATHHGHPSATYAFADATMRRRRVRCPPSDSVDGHDGAADARLGELSGAQRGHWGARTSLTYSSHAVLSYGWFTCPFSSEIIILLMCVPTQSPAYSPSSPGSHPAHHQAFKNRDSPRFRALLFTFFFHIAYSPTSPACGARRIGRHTTHRFAWRLRLSLRWFERTRRTFRALLCLPAQYL